MSSFLTQCPHCLTSFRVTDSQLEAADGLVRCGACLGIFSAAANRITLKPTPEEAAAAAPAQTGPDADAALDDETPAEATPDFTPPADAHEPAPTIEEEAASTAFSEVPPAEFVLPGEMAEEDDGDDDEPGPELPVREEFDIPLGDLNLDGEYGLDEELDDEELDDEELDDEELDDEELDDEEPDDEELDEEELDEEELDEDDLDEDDEEFAEESEDGDDDYIGAAIKEESSLELAPAAAPRAEFARVAIDKSELRRHLAQLEDDDALEPLDDEDLNFEEEPVLLDSAPRRSWPVTTGLLLANLVLAALLALQYADANIESLLRRTGFAPIRPFVCAIVDCPLPARSQLDQLVSEQLLVRSHPRYAQALEVNLVFRNDAAEAQPFPAIEIGFHDTSNRLLANRLFQPGEYLPVELRTSDMPARSSLQVMLELVDPGSEAVNYTLVFRER
jgi:predicted Zn finger-like uncharacterized protein